MRFPVPGRNYLDSIERFAGNYIDSFTRFFNDHDAGIRAWNVVNTSSFQTTAKSVTSDTTLDDSSEMIFVDSSSGPVTITLPTASGVEGKRYHIAVTAGSNLVTIDGDGSETVGGNGKFFIPGEGFSIGLVSDGSNWVVI